MTIVINGEPLSCAEYLKLTDSDTLLGTSSLTTGWSCDFTVPATVDNCRLLGIRDMTAQPQLFAEAIDATLVCDLGTFSAELFVEAVRMDAIDVTIYVSPVGFGQLLRDIVPQVEIALNAPYMPGGQGLDYGMYRYNYGQPDTPSVRCNPTYQLDALMYQLEAMGLVTASDWLQYGMAEKYGITPTTRYVDPRVGTAYWYSRLPFQTGYYRQSGGGVHPCIDYDGGEWQLNRPYVVTRSATLNITMVIAATADAMQYTVICSIRHSRRSNTVTLDSGTIQSESSLMLSATVNVQEGDTITLVVNGSWYVSRNIVADVNVTWSWSNYEITEADYDSLEQSRYLGNRYIGYGTSYEHFLGATVYYHLAGNFGKITVSQFLRSLAVVLGKGVSVASGKAVPVDFSFADVSGEIKELRPISDNVGQQTFVDLGAMQPTATFANSRLSAKKNIGEFVCLFIADVGVMDSDDAETIFVPQYDENYRLQTVKPPLVLSIVTTVSELQSLVTDYVGFPTHPALSLLNGVGKVVEATIETFANVRDVTAIHCEGRYWLNAEQEYDEESGITTVTALQV